VEWADADAMRDCDTECGLLPTAEKDVKLHGEMNGCDMDKELDDDDGV